MTQFDYPLTFDAWQFAERGGYCDGKIPLAKLSRLAAMVNKVDGAAHFSIAGSIAEDRTHVLSGTVNATVELICQRCLEPFEQPLEATIGLGLLRSERQLDSLPDHYDPLIADGDVATTELVENELLLAMPPFPHHLDDAACAYRAAPAPVEPADTDDRPQPFAVLSTLLKDKYRPDN